MDMQRFDDYFSSYVQEVEKFLTYNADEILQYQKRKIIELIEYAKLYSEFYRSIYKSINTNFSIEDIPIISKRDLVDNFDAIISNKEINKQKLKEYFGVPFDFDRLLFQSYLAFHTSGSTGEPVNVVWSTEDFAATTANYFVRLTKDLDNLSNHRILYIGITDDYIGGNSWAYQLKNYIDVQIETIFTPIDELCRIINIKQPTIIMTKPSLLGELARMKGKQLFDIKLEKVIFAGEMIAPQDKYDIERYFGVRAHNSYATCETGPIAYQYDTATEQMEIFRNMVYVELIDEKGQVIHEPYRMGNITVTSLQNKTMPILRYNTGDKAFYVNQNIGQTISYVTGRNTSHFIFYDKYDNEIKISEYPFWSLYVVGIMRYQVIQQSNKMLLVRVQYIEDLTLNEKNDVNDKVLQKIRRILNQNAQSLDIEVRFEEGKIYPDASGKIKITHLFRKG